MQDLQSHTRQCRHLLSIYQYINYEVECHSIVSLMRLKATLTAADVLFLTDQSLFKDKQILGKGLLLNAKLIYFFRIN